jgi:hypothetical protein
MNPPQDAPRTTDASLATSLAARKQRWADFYAGRPNARFMVLVSPVEANPPPRPWPNPGERTARIEWAWRAYQRDVRRAAVVDDDFIPFLDPFTGTEIFAEAFGCKVHRPADNMPFALPLITTAAEADRIRVPDLGSSSLAGLFEIADELRRRAGPEAVMRLVDTQSPMDIVALIWNKTELYSAMLETPEAVKQLAAKVHTLFTAFLDEWFLRYGREFIAHFPYYYLPQGVTLSEDEVGAVSPAMFREFFLPELQALSDRYGGLGMHCCANSRHQWDNFKRIRQLRMLNLCQPPEVIREAYRAFAGPTGQHHGFWDAAVPPWEWPARLPPGARMVIEVGAKDGAEATATLAKIRRACR